MKIQKEFPELSKYIDEMPISSMGAYENVHDAGNLKEYYNSLKEMLESYSEVHVDQPKRNSKN